MVLIFAAHSNTSEQILREVRLVTNSHLLRLFLGLFNSGVSDPGYNCTAIKGNEQTKKAHAVKHGG
jgi:hypothetical protein